MIEPPNHTMELPDEILLSRRRRFIVGAVLFLLLSAAIGIQMIVSGYWAGYFATPVCGVAAILWASRLLIPPDDLLAMRDSHFAWFAPEYVRTSSLLSQAEPDVKPTRSLPELMPSCGVWDREFDGIL